MDSKQVVEKKSHSTVKLLLYLIVGIILGYALYQFAQGFMEGFNEAQSTTVGYIQFIGSIIRL